MALKSNFTILSIDTSCDETSAAVTSDLRTLSNVIASQVEIHKKYGGVYPTEAKRAHQQNIDPVIQEALRHWQIIVRRNKSQATGNLLFERIPHLPKGEGGVENSGRKHRPTSRLGSKSNDSKAKTPWNHIDALAVTIGPGLAPALEVGIKKAKQLASKFNKPLIAVNHMEGHLLSPLAQNSKGKSSIECQMSNVKCQMCPALGLLVSGGHTQLVLINSIGDYQLLGETRDDAAGECFDKVARLLNLGYPGGPIISELAKLGDPQAFDLPIPMKSDPSLDFSFSGLKTACKYLIQGLPDNKPSVGTHRARATFDVGAYLPMNRQQTQDFCASFQKTIVDALLLKVEAAIQSYQAPPVGTRRARATFDVGAYLRSLWLGGGVGANWQLRRELRQLARKYKLPLFTPYSSKLFTDNAAMIGIAAYFQALRGDFVTNLEDLDRLPNLSF